MTIGYWIDLTLAIGHIKRGINKYYVGWCKSFELTSKWDVEKNREYIK